ncbi:MAG: hypothetical protein ACK5LC_10265 [Coprobacillaceae bacterium]
MCIKDIQLSKDKQYVEGEFPQLLNINENHQVTYVYEKSDCKITIRHLDSNHNEMKEPTVVPITSTMNSYEIQSLQTDNNLVPSYITERNNEQETVIQIATIDNLINTYEVNLERKEDVEIIYYYGEDNNHNGVPDYDIKVQYHRDRMGTAVDESLLPEQHIIVDQGGTFFPEIKNIDGYTYKEYELNNKYTQVQPSSIDNIHTNQELNYIYESNIPSITLHFLDRNGDIIQDAQVINITDEDIEPLEHKNIAIPGYTFSRWKKNNSDWSYNQLPNINDIYQSSAITLEYIADYQPITLVYVDKNGKSIRSDEIVMAETNSSFTPDSTYISNYILMDWKVNNEAQWRDNTSPELSLTPVGNTTIVLRYNNDKIKVNKHYEDINQTSVKESDSKDITLSNVEIVTFNDLHKGVSGYEYTGYRLNHGEIIYGKEPSVKLTSQAENFDITYVYTRKEYSIMIQHVYKDGSVLTTNETVRKQSNDSINIEPLLFTEKTYISWSKDGINQGNEKPSIEGINKDYQITLIYGQDKTQDGIEDFTILETYQNMITNDIYEQQTKYINKGDSYYGEIKTIYTNEYI